MQLWTVEHGTFWGLETNNGPPPLCSARVDASFSEVGIADVDNLALAMSLPSSKPIRQRFENFRRCFSLKTAAGIICYGWVTHGPESVGELERHFHLHDDEAYIWDCGTVPAWRRKRCYSALLSHIVHRLHEEGVTRIWIGASRLNQPSVRGFANAGFEPVVDLTYRRFYCFTLMWLRQAPSAQTELVSAAYRILLKDRERRIGPLVVGCQLMN